MTYIYGMPIIHSRMIRPKESEVYKTYWKFAVERQKIFFNKLQGIHPYTEDEILSRYKFTNAYRVLDRVSQYLIREVIYGGDYSVQDTFYRILLFKIFNKIETWKYLEASLGELTWANHSFEKLSKALLNLDNSKISVYSGAYIMASGKSYFGFEKKLQNHLRLLELMMKEEAPRKLQEAKSLEEVFNYLKTFPTIGDFLAFQYSIDLNYSNLIDFSEMDFVVAGPGAKDGVNKCFIHKGSFSYEDIIRLVTDNQKEEFERFNLSFQNLWGRDLMLIDCQNLFCEVDKYSRVAHPTINGSSSRTRIKQTYRPSNGQQLEIVLPPKWDIKNL